MSCFFGCFRIKASDSYLTAPQQKEIVVSRSRNALSSLFLNDDDSVQKGEQSRNEHHDVLDLKKLKNEGKFLKTSGTIPETPTEFKNASEKSENASAPYGGEKLIPILSVEELSIEKQCEESPVAAEACDKSLTGSGSLLVDSPSSCMTDGPSIRRSSINTVQNSYIQEKTIPLDAHDTGTHSETSSVPPDIFAQNVQYRTKNVRCDFHSDESSFSANGSSSGNSYQRSRQTELARSISVTNTSPYPTSLNDEIQTRGTVLVPAIVDMDDVGKTTRVRSRYVHSVSNPIKMSSEWKENEDVTSDCSTPVESVKPNNEGTLTSTTKSEKGMRDEKQMGDEVSSSARPKPPFTMQNRKNEQFGTLSGEKVCHRRIPSDRPILGMVAAHWNEEEVSDVLPKWWDGNGIPNSTNKYKEDQIISWHATSFEERLEKALSEESSLPQRNPVISGIRSVELDEPEESDTAMSHLDSSARLKSVASY